MCLTPEVTPGGTHTQILLSYLYGYYVFNPPRWVTEDSYKLPPKVPHRGIKKYHNYLWCVFPPMFPSHSPHSPLFFPLSVSYDQSLEHSCPLLSFYPTIIIHYYTIDPIPSRDAIILFNSTYLMILNLP